MKRTFKTIFCAAAAVLAAVSCQKSAEPAMPAEEGKETIDVSVNGLMGEYNQQDGVKSSLVNTVRVAWAAGDIVYVFDGSKYLGKLTATLDKKADGQTDEDRYAKLSGTISAPATTPCTLTLVHSSLMTKPEDGAEVSELSIDMSTQSTKKVPFVAYATMDYTDTAISDAVVPFQFATSVIKVNCTGLKANTAITSATLTNVNTACKLTLSGSEAPTVSGDVNGTITRTGDAYFAADQVNDEGEAVFQIAVPKLSEVPEARVLTVAQGSDKFKDKNFSKKAINPATSVNTVCQLVGLPAGALKGEFSVGPNATDKVHFSQGNLYAKKDGSKWNWKFYDNQYEYNSLNSQCDEDGNREAGESDAEIDLLTWGFCASTSLNPVDVVYVTSHPNEFDVLDYDKSSSQGGDDWGVAYCESNSIDVGTWRTLTSAEWQYLFKTDTPNRMVNGKPCSSNAMEGVTIEDANYKGVFLYPDNYNGEVVSSSMTWDAINAAGIVFLPAAGLREGPDVFNVGGNCDYWSSSASDSDGAYGAGFRSYGVFPDIRASRSSGRSVRLITECQ